MDRAARPRRARHRRAARAAATRLHVVTCYVLADEEGVGRRRARRRAWTVSGVCGMNAVNPSAQGEMRLCVSPVVCVVNDWYVCVLDRAAGRARDGVRMQWGGSCKCLTDQSSHDRL